MLALYFTNWSIYSNDYLPENAPLDKATHVIYAFFKPNAETGGIDLSDPWGDVEKPMPSGEKGCIAELIRLKSVYNFRLLVSVGGYTYSSALTEIINNSEKREVFIKSAVEIVKKYRFDGIDIDWEYPQSTQEGRNFVTLLRHLKQALPSNADLSLAAPAGTHILQYMPLSEMDRYLSFWNVMTYDFAGGWSPNVEYAMNLYGPYPSCETVIDEYLKYVPSNKVLLGVTLYKLVYPNAYQLHGKYNGTPVQTPIGLETQKGVFDSKYGCAYYIGQDTFSCSECQQSVLLKADFIKQRNLGGAFFWDASADAKPSLINLLASNL